MYQYRAKLIKVVDGDTVDAMIDCGFSTFKKERIRLHGINTPETRTRDKKEKEKGLAAKARLIELIEEGNNEFIVKTSIDKKGKYGRLLGTLYKDEASAKACASTSEPMDTKGLDAFWPPAGGALVTKVFSYNETLVKEGHAVEYFGGKK
jgi:endonuclease YncB( thermonuclease family)|tara:strand:- start:3274 stop:3723 length:450 start_codon:yes stop_codon:yes gene_type:complete